MWLSLGAGAAALRREPHLIYRVYLKTLNHNSYTSKTLNRKPLNHLPTPTSCRVPIHSISGLSIRTCKQSVMVAQGKASFIGF